MTAIALVEIISAIFLGVILIRLISERKNSKSNKLLLLSTILCVFSLVIDAMAYTFVGPKYPVAFRYILNFLAFEIGVINSFGFTLYTKSFIEERKKVNLWVFISVLIVEFAWFLSVAIEFFMGHFISYDNEGLEVINYSIPIYIQVISIIVLVYLSIVALWNRKEIGNEVAILFCVFNLTPIIGILVANFTHYDFTYIFGAVALVLIIEFLQRKLTFEHIKKQNALSDGLAREYHTVWLMDGFGSHNLHLYRSTGKTTVQSAVQLGLDEPCFDTSIVKYIRDNVVEEDQDRVIEATRFETIERETPEIGTYVVTYRRYIDDRSDYTYHQMCFARATGLDGKVNYILAYRDVDTMMREQNEQQKQLEEALKTSKLESIRNKLVYDIARASTWSYEIDVNGKISSASYSSRVRRLVLDNENGNPMDWTNHVHPDDRANTVANFFSSINDRSGETPYEVTYRMMFNDGDYHWLKSSGRLISHDDGTAEMFGMSVDISGQMEKEKEQNERLEEALDKAEVANKAKTDFLFNMSHDIRTPMNAIIGLPI